MKKRLYLSGSLTVEASFIIPIVLFAYVFVIYGAFYAHDRIQAQNYTALIADHLMKGCMKNIDLAAKQVDYRLELSDPLSEQWDDALDQQKSYIIAKGRKELQSKMLMSRIRDIDIECSFRMITRQMRCTVTIRGSMQYSLKIFGLSGASFEVCAEEKATDAVKYLWQEN